jgi:catechol 2,3-dioxygenase-like lactoylglutathione lyase family enzyme
MSTLRSPLFHIAHVVDRLDDALDCHRRLFRRPVLDGGYWEIVRRHAIFTSVGGIWIEAMTPDRRGGGLRKFVDRFGSRLHSLAWYVEGIDEIADELHRRGVRFYDTDGAIIKGVVPRHGPMPLPPGYRHSYPPNWSSAVLYTTFRDAHGMVELCQPSSDHPLPPRDLDEDMRPDSDPLGIISPSHQTMVVAGCETAASFYVEVLGGQLFHQSDNAALGVRSAFVLVGEGPGTVLELAEPTADGPAKVDLEICGRPMLHRTTFRVRDLAAVRDHLAVEDFGVEFDKDGLLITDPDTTVGARFAFTDRELADDPRI